MLKLDFLNVGDGDAILVRDDAADFVMLVDTGRPHIEFTKGSRRTSVINHLMRERIDHINLLVLTHLHFDHIGGTLHGLFGQRQTCLLIDADALKQRAHFIGGGKILAL